MSTQDEKERQADAEIHAAPALRKAAGTFSRPLLFRCMIIDCSFMDLCSLLVLSIILESIILKPEKEETDVYPEIGKKTPFSTGNVSDLGIKLFT